MDFSITSFTVGILAGVFVTLAIVFPQVGRFSARALGTTATALGVGMLIWAFDTAARESEITGIVIGDLQIRQISDAIGWGVGLLVGGIVALLLSFFGHLPGSDSHEGIHRSLAQRRTSLPSLRE